MHCTKPENVAEHSHQVAVIAHILCVIKKERYGGTLDPEKAATLAIFHEVSETKLQDQNHVVKYHNPEFTKQYKKLELLAEQECLDTLPDDLKDHYADLIIQNNVDPDYRQILKASDTLSAYLKALDEQKFGNVEFDYVRKNIEQKLILLKQDLPEVNDFLNVFAESCLASIDELSSGTEPA